MCYCFFSEGLVFIVEICNNLLKGFYLLVEVIEDFRERYIKF